MLDIIQRFPSLYHFSFVRTWTVPLTSSHIQTAVNYRSPEERLAMFSQLELWLSASIRQQGMEQGEAGDMEDPQHTARSITQQLVTSGFQVDQLLAMYKTRGLSVLELQVGRQL